jgi:hypothetical protein
MRGVLAQLWRRLMTSCPEYSVVYSGSQQQVGCRFDSGSHHALKGR